MGQVSVITTSSATGGVRVSCFMKDHVRYAPVGGTGKAMPEDTERTWVGDELGDDTKVRGSGAANYSAKEADWICKEMREFKFRAWHLQQELMSKPFTPFTKGSYHMFFVDKNQKPHDITWPSDAIYMQYTGLKDHKGKEIYEGDVVHVVETYAGDHRIPAGNRVVKFEEGGFEVNDWGEGLAHYALNGYCEVVGNIYENPELINE